MVQKYEMENSNKKKFISFKMHTRLNGVRKSHAVLLCPSQDMNSPSAQCLHAVHVPHLFVIYRLSWLSDRFSARERDRVPITFIAVYSYNCSILLLAVAINFLLRLICKLKFIIGVFVSI